MEWWIGMSVRSSEGKIGWKYDILVTKQELPEAIRMTWDDEDWVQTLDYEQIPFHCQWCHEYGHIFRDFHMNHPNNVTGKEEDKKYQGFTRVPSRKGGGRKQENREVHKKTMVSNKFEILEYIPKKDLDNQTKGKQRDQIP